ncbi:MAG: DUF2993 domain-containing protein [Cyanobacteria bacterium J06623_7]
MEVLTIILAGIISLGSSGGIILDKIARSEIGDRVTSIERQAVRIDNQPNYDVARGKLARVRIANRGVYLEPGVRVAVLDLETDPLAVRLDRLSFSSIEGLRQALKSPAQVAARIVLAEADLNQALQAPEVRQQLEDNLNRLIASRAGANNISYGLQDMQLELRPQNRLGVSFKLERLRSTGASAANRGTSPTNDRSRELEIGLELTLKIVDGQRISLVDPQGVVNGRPMSTRLLNGFATGFSDRLNLNLLAADGILARILQLEINEDNLQLVGFVKVEPKQP